MILSGRPACLPDNVLSHLVYCRSIVESLRKEGPFSGSEYGKALEALGAEVFGDIKSICMVLLESALNLALTPQPKGSAVEEFGNIIGRIVEAWRSAGYEYRPIIQRLCEELPSNEAKDLWSTLNRLRAD